MGRILSKFFEMKLLAILRFLAILPARWIEPMASGLIAMGSPLLKRERQRIALNIGHVFNLPAHSEFSKSFQAQVLNHQVTCALESLIAAFRPERIKIIGLDNFKLLVDSNLAAGKGLIIITGHLGSWELVGYYTSVVTKKVFSALGKPSKYDAVTRVLNYTRKLMNTAVLWTDDNMLFKKMLKVLTSGSALGFVMDQKPARRSGPMVDFMGRPTSFVSGPAISTIRTGAPVMGVFCVREGSWRYRLICSPLLPANHNMTDEVEVTAIMAKEIERIIRLYPEQWAWNYKRWRFS